MDFQRKRLRKHTINQDSKTAAAAAAAAAELTIALARSPQNQQQHIYCREDGDRGQKWRTGRKESQLSKQASKQAITI